MSSKECDVKIADEDGVQHLVQSDTSLEVGSSEEVSGVSNTTSLWNKYKKSLKTFIPVRPFAKKNGAHPSDSAGLFSFGLFSWMTILIWKLFRKASSAKNLWKVSQHDEAEINYRRLAHLWKNEVRFHGSANASVWRVSFRFLRLRLAISVFLTMLATFASFFTNSYVIHNLLKHVSQPSSHIAQGFTLLVILAVTEITRAVAISFLFAVSYRSAIRLRSALILFLFKKVLKLPLNSGNMGVGQLISLCSNDGDRIFEAARLGFLVVNGPILFVCGAIYSCAVLGPTALIGSGFFLVMLFVQGLIAKISDKLRERAIVETEERVKIISEVLAFIKLIKFYCWEASFSDHVEKVREKELHILKFLSLTQSINVTLAFLTPVVAAVLVLTCYVLSGKELNSQNAFTCIAIFNAMSYGLKMMPIGIRSLAEFNVTARRFEKVFLLESRTSYICSVRDETNVIEIENASFCWELPHPTENVGTAESEATSSDNDLLLEAIGINSKRIPVLKNINLVVKKGTLVGIYGAVGSGKSSLVSAILGNMYLMQGSVGLYGSVAYTAQEAWLMNATVRDNILFGCKFTKAKYNEIVSACCLLDDFTVLQGGDLAEVGDRGINLSGGQKQRISVARALYSDRDVYILDDPLSAVDIHVGKHIFNQAILGYLKKSGKTILLITHQIQLLMKCDHILVMDQGELKKKPEDLETENLELLPSKTGENVSGIDGNSAPLVSPKDLSDEERAKQGKLVSDEESGLEVPFSTYAVYIKAASGWLLGVTILLLYGVNVGVQQFSNLWLSFWLNRELELFDGCMHGNCSDYLSTNVTGGHYILALASSKMNTNHSAFSSSQNVAVNSDSGFFVLIYGLSAIAMLIVSVLRGWAYLSYTFQAVRTLHRQLLERILNAPMSFFDTTPSGRIINRFQKDFDEADGQIALIWEIFIFNAVTVVCALGIVAYIFPKFLFVTAFAVVLLTVVRGMFKPAASDIKRQDALTRSPWFSHIRTTITGLETIRAYQRTNHFILGFIDRLNDNASPYYLFACANRWFAVRLDLLMVTLCVFTALFVILNRGLVSPAFAGLALMTAFMLSGLLQFTFRMLTESEARFVCVDRIADYIKNTPQESDSNEQEVAPVEKWPKEGKIEFCKVSMRYRSGLPLALNSVSFTVEAGEKIGVVGRTGSGKSSLTVSLFRLVELSDGNILVDDVDIATLSLSRLRSGLSIIPQDPVVFTGSVRYNLDPFDQHSNDEIWNAVRVTHLNNAISSLPGQLEHVLTESGNNLSLGERQLLCLARVLLRNSKVLVLDEATAAVDFETEKLVQETIREAFANCTVITIAHRLSTVLTMDRVIVMGDGHVVEFDTPGKLTENKDSAFAKMLSAFEG